MKTPADRRDADEIEAEYRRRLSTYSQELGILGRRNVQLSLLRAATAVVALVVAWLAIDRSLISPWWIAGPVFGFVALVFVHAAVARKEAVNRRLSALYQRGLDRLEGTWQGCGTGGADFASHDHPFAVDLDLFGTGSLFELLCMARTRMGERTLARWLKDPASPREVAQRQAAVVELAERADLRERLAVVGEEDHGLESGGLISWVERRVEPVAAFVTVAAVALTTTEALILTLWLVQGWGGELVLPLLFFHGVLMFRLRPLERRLLEGVAKSASELALLARLLEVAEKADFTSDELVTLQRALATDEMPSVAVERLNRRVQLYESQSNMMFAPIAGFLFLGFHLAVDAERWRQRHQEAVPVWLSSLGRLEALASIAWFAHENPEDPFPELLTEGPVLTAEGLTHPLLPRERAVRNDVHLDQATRVLIVSGSNMSGKSTLLRSVGVNLVLAQAGAPVRARRFEFSPLALGASIATVDSLSEGRSRFFTEIMRLKQVVDLCSGSHPVLFLIDEVLHGTNSHERRIGAELLLLGLLERGAVGLLTTHDLALTTLADDQSSNMSNVHFQDEVDGEQLKFDYLLRPGTVTRSNALALMRLVGLPVE